MKTKTLVLALVLTATSTSVFSNSNYIFDKGQVGDGGIMNYSLVPPVVINITTKDNIEVTFTKDVGLVIGLVKNNSGITIAQVKADTSIEANMNINIANLPAGTYIFTIVTEQGSTVISQKFTVD